MSPPSVDIAVPRTEDAPAVARRALEQAFDGAVCATALDDAKLVATELVANALAHGEGEITLRGALAEDCLRIEVIDEGEGQARIVREEGESEAGGWGLQIVDAVSLRWGAHEGTTHVWAELPLH